MSKENEFVDIPKEKIDLFEQAVRKIGNQVTGISEIDNALTLAKERREVQLIKGRLLQADYRVVECWLRENQLIE